MKLNLYSVYGIIIYVVIFSVRLLFDQTMSKSTNAVDANADLEEFQRRREILNKYRESFVQNEKDWVETYSFNFGTIKIKDLSENSISDESEFNEIASPPTDDVEQWVIKNVQSIKKDTKQTDNLLYNKKNVTNDDIEIVEDNAKNYAKFNEMKKQKIIDMPGKSESNEEIKLNINPEIESNYIKSFPQESDPNIQNVHTEANNQKLPIISKMLMERRRIVDAYMSSHLKIQSHNIENDLKRVNNEKKIAENSNVFSSKYIKNVEIKEPLAESIDLIHRQKIVNSFLSQYGKYSRTDDWVDTYNPNFKVHNKDFIKYDKKVVYVSEKFSINYSKYPISDFLNKTKSSKLRRGRETKEIDHIQASPVIDCVQMSVYFSRWINKLLSKIEGAEHKSISFTFSSEFVNNLKAFTSEKFDIVNADELICGIISNATFNESHSYNWISFSFNLNNMSVYITIVTSLFVIYCLLRKQFFLLFILLIFVGIIQHVCKRHQTITARKHSVTSLVSSAHCINSLSEKSGLYEHFSEYIRSLWYDEECKKYYEALMVDNFAENNILHAIVDLISSIIIQPLEPLSHALNNFSKESLYNTSFYQKCFIIILLIGFIFCIIFCLLLYFGCKIKLPFFLGSIEPPSGNIGSQVEDVRPPKGSFFKQLLFGNSNESVSTLPDSISKNNVEKDEIIYSSDQFTNKNEQIASNSSNEIDVANQDDTDCVRKYVANCQCAKLNPLNYRKPTQCESCKGMNCKYPLSLHEEAKCINNEESAKDFRK